MGRVVCAWNPNTWEVEPAGLELSPWPAQADTLMVLKCETFSVNKISPGKYKHGTLLKGQLSSSL